VLPGNTRLAAAIIFLFGNWILGKLELLAGKIQETYEVDKDEAEKQFKAFEDRNKDYRP
jgi:hypothetical protein